MDNHLEKSHRMQKEQRYFQNTFVKKKKKKNDTKYVAWIMMLKI